MAKLESLLPYNAQKTLCRGQGAGGVKIKHRHLTQAKHDFILGLKVQNILFTAKPHKNSEYKKCL